MKKGVATTRPHPARFREASRQVDDHFLVGDTFEQLTMIIAATE